MTTQSKSKIWFLCYCCYRYSWLQATKETIEWYEGLGDDVTFCLYCDDYKPTEYNIDRKPPMPISAKFNLPCPCEQFIKKWGVI